MRTWGEREGKVGNTHSQSSLYCPFKINYGLLDCVVTSIFTTELINTKGKRGPKGEQKRFWFLFLLTVRHRDPEEVMSYFVARSMFFLVNCSLGSECCRLRNSATALAGNSVSHTYPKSLARWTASPGKRWEEGSEGKRMKKVGIKTASQLPYFLNPDVVGNTHYLFSHFRHFLSFSVGSGGCTSQGKWPLSLEGPGDWKM